MTHDVDRRAVKDSRSTAEARISRTRSSSRGQDLNSSDASPLDPFADLSHYLATVETARRHQLAMLPTLYLDPAAGAHRAAVDQVVEEVVTARHRLAAGLYGVCTGCNEPIAPERLEFRPWATKCTACSQP